ncbi:MAG: hypothetical protein JW819_05145 [Candidatus Krumholzibacteriota bacterium]|nr:hypothetical protein [Candidatus Krumholzibacteriota bacterium]
MLKKLVILMAIMAIAVPAWSAVVSRDGTEVDSNPSVLVGEVSIVRSDFEYNTGGAIDVIPTLGGSASGWAWYILHVLTNSTGHDLWVKELGFPCNMGTGEVTWPVEWVFYAGGLPGDPYATAWTFSGDFTPVDTGTTLPPTIYTYIDVEADMVILPNGSSWAWGYENPGYCGQVSYNGVETWGWWSGLWESDVSWGRTAVLQIKADYYTTPVQDATISAVKALF